jgi:hypothetical protein
MPKSGKTDVSEASQQHLAQALLESAPETGRTSASEQDCPYAKTTLAVPGAVKSFFRSPKLPSGRLTGSYPSRHLRQSSTASDERRKAICLPF